MRCVGREGIGIGLSAIVLFASGVASAQSQQVCGSTNNGFGWNVPAGDPVFVSGPGPVYSVLSAEGEYRSHSMLSNGPNGWVTHATSITPPTNSAEGDYGWDQVFGGNDSECWNPVSPSFLYAATPGLEQVTQGGIYTFLYNGGTATASTGVGPGENFIAYQRSYDYAGTNASASAINSTSWDLGVGGLSYTANYDNGNLFYGITYNGTQIHYGWYQYMNVQGTATGTPGVNNGVVCSSSLALWQHDANVAAPYNTAVSARTYANNKYSVDYTTTTGDSRSSSTYDEQYDELSVAGSALWNGVNSECNSTTGWFSSVGSFFTNLGWSGLCLGVTGFDQGVCGQASDQVANCFAANNCGNTSSPGAYWGSYTASDDGTTQWQAAIAASSAVGISPDDIAGWNQPWLWNGSAWVTDGAPTTGAGASVWGWDLDQTVQWNNGGNSYGCWD